MLEGLLEQKALIYASHSVRPRKKGTVAAGNKQEKNVTRVTESITFLILSIRPSLSIHGSLMSMRSQLPQNSTHDQWLSSIMANMPHFCKKKKEIQTNRAHPQTAIKSKNSKNRYKVITPCSRQHCLCLINSIIQTVILKNNYSQHDM